LNPAQGWGPHTGQTRNVKGEWFPCSVSQLEGLRQPANVISSGAGKRLD